MFIKARNYNVSDKVRTTLSTSAASGASSLTVRNTAGFTANDYVVLEQPGTEKAEIVQISSVTNATTLALSGTTSFAHSSDTQVAFIKYNQVRFFLGDTSAAYSTGSLTVTHGSKTITGVGTTFTGGNVTTSHSLQINEKFYDIASIDSATQVTLTIPFEEESAAGHTYKAILFSAQTTIAAQIDRHDTTWDDTDGIAEDFYRVAYYNSTTASVSSLSDVISASGSDRNATRKIIEDIRFQTGERIENSTTFSDDELMRLLDEAQEDVWSKSKDLWWWDADVNITTVASQVSYDLPSDFQAVLSVRGNDGTNETDALREVSYQEYVELVENNSAESDDFEAFALWGGRIYLYPTPDTAVANGVKILYRMKPLSLDSGGDISRIPESRVLKLYAMAKVMEIKDEPRRATNLMNQYIVARDRMVGMEIRNHGRTQRFIFNPQYKQRRTR